MAKTLRRPSRPMMEAVNAAIAGKRAEANKIVTEFKLSKRELDTRLDIRDGEKYPMKRKANGKTTRKKTTVVSVTTTPSVRSNGRPEDLLRLMDGRTNTATLLRISYPANELIDAKPKIQVRKIEKAMDEAADLKRKYEEAVALIGDEILI